MSIVKWISDVFWTDSLWLAPGITWADVTNGPGKKVVYPDSSDFYYLIPLIVALLVLRYVLEKYCFARIGAALGIAEKKKRKLQYIPLLESAYRRSALDKDVTGLAKQLDMTERQVERWWRVRRNQDKPSNLAKFCEHSWKASYLLCSTSGGFYMLWGKDWFWDLDKCFIGYPHQGVTNDIWWFYMTNTAYIIVSTITFNRDVKRKDYWQMFLHHVVTGALLYLSWMISLFRNGAVLLPILDSSEAVLEVTKAFKRAKFDRTSKLLFMVFTAMWFYTRLYLFPLHLYGTSIRAPRIIEEYFAGYLLNIFLYLLLVLTVYWSKLILTVAYNFLALGVERDVRSSSSEVTDDSLCENNLNNGINGHKNSINSSNHNSLNWDNLKNGVKDHKNGINGHKNVINNSNHNNGLNASDDKNIINGTGHKKRYAVINPLTY